MWRAFVKKANECFFFLFFFLKYKSDRSSLVMVITLVKWNIIKTAFICTKVESQQNNVLYHQGRAQYYHNRLLLLAFEYIIHFHRNKTKQKNRNIHFNIVSVVFLSWIKHEKQQQQNRLSFHNGRIPCNLIHSFYGNITKFDDCRGNTTPINRFYLVKWWKNNKKWNHTKADNLFMDVEMC